MEQFIAQAAPYCLNQTVIEGGPFQQYSVDQAGNLVFAGQDNEVVCLSVAGDAQILALIAAANAVQAGQPGALSQPVFTWVETVTVG